MNLLLMMSFIMIILANIFILLSFLISKKSMNDREKCTPFECGFDPMSLSRIPFSLHFFLITVIFLIFDVEIALIFPMISTFLMVNFMTWFKISFFFIIMLLVGTYHEWNQNMLNWTN
uniref:NADH-ubiquinone oxidoreductase chain 3 n=1 Tax=Lexias dirtea TaxID=1113266 RepID=A0A067YCS3_LEXDI|nr:NADH dehydrogenase subunit 3 [Lexias dirtea]AHA03617.1 NADH dehydrogenase subunit 3 [Lexias dirtea]